MKKRCTRCRKLLPLDAFNKQKHGLYGVRGKCRKCSNELFSVYASKNRDKARARYERAKRLWPDRIKEQAARSREKHRLEAREWHRRHYVENREMYLEKQRKRFATVEGRRWRSEHHKKLTSSNVEYRLSRLVRSRLWAALHVRKNKKSTKTTRLLGCSIDFLRGWLEKQFKRGMSWENCGTWHVDHITPCCKFDLSKVSEQRKCFNYKNLQPLWAKENLEKGGR